ncbi:hypothetical protein ES332_A06G206100v1 [Gossypium tomentosum]|uniref:Uncharacterized protein n=1 Tax=Gossypium tomentosum TaxID=34277 RepID=A0A5D2Q7J4_GOSTO|nr:hypothetical protein ES332_A06G206100v1 [Gossypium tomentosum]
MLGENVTIKHHLYLIFNHSLIAHGTPKRKRLALSMILTRYWMIRPTVAHDNDASKLSLDQIFV